MRKTSNGEEEMNKVEERQITSLCSRYLIPFFYGEGRACYEQICEKLCQENPLQWELTDVKQQAEQDIYEYLLHAFSGQADHTSLGSVWRYTGGRNTSLRENKGLKNLLYNSTGQWGDMQGQKEDEEVPAGAVWMDRTDTIELRVTEAGLFLFRTGVGFFWYELKVTDQELALPALKKLKNKLKEINRREESERLLEICGTGFLKKEEPLDTLVLKGESKQDVEQTAGAILFAEKKAKERIDIQPEETENGVVEVVEKVVQLIGWKYSLCRKFTFGNWVAEILSQLSEEIRYCAPKKNCLIPPEEKPKEKELLPLITDKQNETDVRQLPQVIQEQPQKTEDRKLPQIVPDKALIYFYGILSREQAVGEKTAGSDRKEVYESLYHLSNGYTEAYHMPEQITERMYRPFENVLWMASREGCACLTTGNVEFLRYGMIHKFTSDYFLLYVLALHQSYTLLKYADEISSQMSAQWEDYTRDAAEVFTRLEQKMSAIQVFLMKSTTASVSHIQHQNEFYRYLQKRLQIREDIKSVTQGLEALTEIQRIHYEAEQRAKEKEEEERRRKQKAEQETKENEEKIRRQKQEDAQREKEKQEQEKQDMMDSRLNISLGLVSLLAAISAYCDGTALLQVWWEKGDGIAEYLKQPKYWTYIVLYGIVTILGIYAVCALLGAFRQNLKHRQEIKKRK